MKSYILKWKQVVDADLSGYIISYKAPDGKLTQLIIVPKSIYALTVMLPTGITTFYAAAFDVAGNLGVKVPFKAV